MWNVDAGHLAAVMSLGQAGPQKAVWLLTLLLWSWLPLPEASVTQSPQR